MFSIKAIILKTASLTCIAGLLMVVNLPLFSAFEAHVINVTAKIVNDTPGIDPPGGEFCDDGELEVILNVTLEGAAIYYTVDGSDPICYANGSLYSSPFPLLESATVKAVSCHDGKQSAIMSEYYDVSSVYCDVECGPCDGKITELTLQYNGSQAAVIKVVQKKGGDEVFNNNNNIVNPGEQFSFTGTWGVHPTLGTEITIYVNGVEHIEIHTSCSEPIGLGMVFGDFLVIAGESRNGGPLCPAFGNIVLNEFLPNPTGGIYGDDGSSMPLGEWVELYNNENYTIDLLGWYIKDESNHKIVISDSNTLTTTAIGANGSGNEWLVVYMNQSIWNNSGASGVPADTVSLYDLDDDVNPIDSYSYYGTNCSFEPTPGGDNPDTPPSGCNQICSVPDNKSYARIPDGTGGWVDPIPTPGAPNVLEDFPVVLSGPAPDVIYNSPPAELPIEEPLVEELATELPVEEIPVEEEPVSEEPSVEDPLAEEFPVKDPIAEPIVEEIPVDEEPTIEEPVTSEFPVEELPAEEPASEDLPVEDPPVKEPVTSEPPVEEPPTEELPVEEPAPEDPPVEDPPVEEPPTEEPAE